MKRILIVTIMVSVLAASNSFAQMGHGMMREMPEGMMHEHMMGNMTDMINELSGLMGKMSEMMKDMPKENMNSIAEIMKDMSFEMSRMSEMMDRGAVTDEEIKAVHSRIIELQKRMMEMGK